MSLINTDGIAVKTNTTTGDGKCLPVYMGADEAMIQDGDRYTSPDIDTDVDIASPKYWHIITPNTTVRCHFKAIVSATGAIKVELYEGFTESANGTEITPLNNDRNSTNTATMATYYDPTVSADGDLVDISYAPAATPCVIGEYIMKQNTQYAVKVTAVADNTVVACSMQWYEV